MSEHALRPPAAATSALPLTVDAWLSAYRQGAEPRRLLLACRRRALSDSPPATWIHLASESQLSAQIDALDALLAGTQGREALLARYPLFGVPYAVKDNIDIAGAPTTAACPEFAYQASTSAAVIRRLQAAGAVWIGKTNLDQFATGLVGTRSPYGQPASVFDPKYVSGGSSSGSAVSVAAGLVAFALGTDTAGSGRIPAAFNQLVGLKPTPGRVGSSGVVPACRTLDCVSILALTVSDAARVLSVIEGDDADDDYSRFTPGAAAWKGTPLRIGVPSSAQIDAPYRAAFDAALARARALGASIVARDFSALHATADLLYAGPWVAERHSVVDALLAARPHAFDPVVREIIGSATRFSATDAFRAQYRLKSLQKQTGALWADVDLLLVPSAPRHPRLVEVAADPVRVNSQLGVYTNFVNLLGWCALAVPAGTAANALPFGITFIAPANHDALLAEFGARWQDSLDLPLGGSGVRASALTPSGLPACRPAVQATLPLAVVGAHLSGMPLNGQLRERGARLRETTRSAARYRLYALPATTPAKPGLVRTPGTGHDIELEVWDVPLDQVGALLAQIQAPLGLGSIELADGRWVHGFLCEAGAVVQAEDISRFGGWRNYIQSHSADATTPRHAAG